VPPSGLDALVAEARRLNLTLSAIGELRRGNEVKWSLHGADFVPPLQGYDHFRRASTQITV